MIVMAMIVMRDRLIVGFVNDGRVRAERRRAMRRCAVGVPEIVMIDSIAAGIAAMCANDGNQPRKHRADQRQENDSLNHDHASLRMTSRQARPLVRESRSPLLRIMR